MADQRPVQISMLELREAVARVLDAVEQKFGSTLDLDADFYWSVDPVESFEPTIPLQQLVGSIVEDVEDTRELLKREDRSEDLLSVWHDIAHLAGIFLRISALDSPRTRPSG